MNLHEVGIVVEVVFADAESAGLFVDLEVRVGRVDASEVLSEVAEALREDAVSDPQVNTFLRETRWTSSLAP